METDIFLVKLRDACDDHSDRDAAIGHWLEENWMKPSSSSNMPSNAERANQDPHGLCIPKAGLDPLICGATSQD